MTRQVIDKTGQKFNRWTVLRRGKKDNNNNVMWLCRCECGTIREVRGFSLVDGTSKSCGCFNIERSRATHITHGMSDTAAYKHIISKRYQERSKNLDNKWCIYFDLELREFCNNSCILCGITEEEHREKFGCSLHVDHVYPLSHGSGLYIGNATLLCGPCNGRKGNRLLYNLPWVNYASIIYRKAVNFEMYLRQKYGINYNKWVKECLNES